MLKQKWRLVSLNSFLSPKHLLSTLLWWFLTLPESASKPDGKNGAIFLPSARVCPLVEKKSQMLFMRLSFDCRKIDTQHLDNAATNFDRTTHMGAVTVSGNTHCYSNKIEWQTIDCRRPAANASYEAHATRRCLVFMIFDILLFKAVKFMCLELL